jgi:predicted DNA-binding protein with PD1-like motif/glutaredoxin
MHPLALKLGPGSDPRQRLEQEARSRGVSGFVVSAVGNLSRAVLRFPGQPRPTVLEGELEIISLTGSLDPQGVHLHLSVSDGEGRVIGGHLEAGSRVHTGADLLVAPIQPTAAGASRRFPQPGHGSADRPPEPRIEVAVLPGCPFSARAVRMLRTLNIPHGIVEITDEEELQRIRELSGAVSLPQVFIDGAAIGGYDALAELHGSGELEKLRL